jgi:hypothetical protein
MKYFPEVTEAILWPLTRLEDNKTRMIPDRADFSWLWFARTTHNLFRGWKHFWFLSPPSNFEIYLLLGLWRVVIWRVFFTDTKITGYCHLLIKISTYINNMCLLILIKRWYSFFNKFGKTQNTHDSGQQTFLDFDLQKRQFVSWVETFLVFVTSRFEIYLLTYLALTNFFTEKKVAGCNLLMKSADATWSRRSRQRTTGTGIKFIHINWEYIALSSLHINTFISHLVPWLKGTLCTWQGRNL